MPISLQVEVIPHAGDEVPPANEDGPGPGPEAEPESEKKGFFGKLFGT